MRIKVMQSLYAWHTNHEEPDVIYELNLKEAVEKVREAESIKGDKGDSKLMYALFYETITNIEKLDDYIEQKTKNWEIERIALLDRIMIHMGLTEILYMQDIPPKVTINEYLEIAKKYSTPKSSKFINGILDALLNEFKTSGTLNKAGRGLVEETPLEKRRPKIATGSHPLKPGKRPRIARPKRDKFN
jgi:N utilization substance protein B